MQTKRTAGIWVACALDDSLAKHLWVNKHFFYILILCTSISIVKIELISD